VIAMMQTTTMPSGLSGLLSGLLGDLDDLQRLGNSGWTEMLDQAGIGEFVQSLAGQIKSFLIKRGADPAEIASIPNQTLVVEFLTLVQGRNDSTSLGLSVAMGLGEQVGDPEALGLTKEGRTSDETSSGDDAPQPVSEAPAWLTMLPTVILERLSEASRILPTSTAAPLVASDPSSTPGVATDSRGLLEVSSTVLETLAHTPWRQDRRAAAGEAQQPDTLESNASASFPSAWLARQLNSDALQARSNIATASNTDVDAVLPAIAEARSGLALRSEPRLESILGLETVPESNESTVLAPAGTPRTPAATPEISPIGARLQTLDLNRLLQPGGEQRLSDHIRWSIDRGLDTAEIKLHPPSLGTLDVRVVQEGEKTHVQFISAHPVAREVLEASLPRLREALAQDGVLLGAVSVSDQAPQDRGRNGREGAESTGVQSLEIEDEDDPIQSHDTLSVLSRRLDVFT